MRKQASTIEWHIAESEAEWERLQATLRPEQAPGAHRRLLQHSYLAAGILLIVFVGVGKWLWQTDWARTHRPVTLTEATASPASGLVAPGRDRAIGNLRRAGPAPDWSLPFAAGESILRTATLTHEDVDLVRVEQRAVNQAGDQVAANLVMRPRPGAHVYRQTRFYQHTDAGWLQIEPDAALWGPERSLETPSFVYHFRQNDAQAVNAVLAQMDTLYNTMRRNIGLPSTRLIGQPFALIGEKLVIEVSVTHSPGNVRYQPHNDERFIMADRLVVASPAVYLAPVELTDAALLAQSIALPLLDQVLAQASEHHEIGEAWQPVVNGLRLWQVWDLDLPLAAWREEVVKWVYVEGPAVSPGQPFVLPDSYPALCAAHKLWLPSPTQLNLPLICGRAEPEWEEQSFPLWRLLDPLTRLDQLIAPLRPEDYIEEPGSSHRAIHPGQTVALATLIEYAVAAYGRERLPALMAGLGRYDSWETLLLAVYGISAREFEAGWQAYLAAQYGLSLETLMP